MAIAIATYAREYLRGVALPVAGAISEDVGLAELMDVVRRFRGLIGDELAGELGRVFDRALAEDVRRALNSENLERLFPDLVARFWARILLPLVELSTKLFTLSTDPRALELVKSVERDLGRALAKVVRGSGYRYADYLVYGLSVLIDRDVWILERTAEYGLDGVVRRFVERGLEALLNLADYTIYLTFVWVSATAAVLGLVKEFREENRDALARWRRGYAGELESYMDTLDILLDDEAYSDLVELGVVKRQA